jgi:WD40 repeat protein
MDSPKVFISYSHDSPEHERRVRMLADRLRASDGVTCMLDQYVESSPVNWPFWMEDQIEAADFVLMVCTETYHRRVRRKEKLGEGYGVLWESNLIYNAIYAKGTNIEKFVPVIFDPADVVHIPAPLAGVNRYAVHSEDGYERLFRRLTAQPRVIPPDVAEAVRILRPESHDLPLVLGRLVNVPSQPPHFLARRERLEAIKAAVLAPGEGSVGVTGAGATGVQGMGGIGKSVLAAAVAYDPDVRQAFRDGIYWLPVGREPSLLELQNQLLRQVAGPRQPLTTSQEVKDALREALDGRRVLVVLDDVWHANHAYILCESCVPARFLITTRDAEVLVAIGAAEHRVDILSPDDALVMLANWTSEKVNALPRQAVEIAKECGYLPLALAAVGAMIRGRPSGWEDALARLHSADLDTIRRAYPGYPYPDLLRALEVSIDVLEEADRERYLDLAVFPEDQPIPEGTLGQLWDLGLIATRDCMARFVDRSLAARTEEGEALVLHDLLRDVTRKRRKAILPQMHIRLLKAWDSAKALPDRYAWQWAAYHLTQANREDDLRRLLLDLGYLQAKLDATDVNALLADYENMIGDPTLSAIRSAIRLSRHVVSRDPEQLANQLRGRLLYHQMPSLQKLLAQTLKPQLFAQLQPMQGTLAMANSHLVQTFQVARKIVSIALGNDGQSAVLGLLDGGLGFWDFSVDHLQIFEGHVGAVTAVAMASHGHRAISSSKDGTVRAWDLVTGQSQMFKNRLDGHVSLAVTASGHHAVLGSSDGVVHVWNLTTGQSYALAGSKHPIHSVAVTDDGNCAVSGDSAGLVRSWDLVTRESRVLTNHGEAIHSVSVLNDRHRVSSVSFNGIHVYDLVTDQLRTVKIRVEGAVAAGGDCVVLGSAKGGLRVWNVETERSLIVEGYRGDWFLMVLAVTPDGRWGVTVSFDDKVRLLDLTVDEPQVLDRHTDWVLSVAVTSDGNHAVSGSSDGTVRIWDSVIGRSRVCEDYSKSIRSVALTPDGRYAVSGSFEGVVRVSNLTTYRSQMLEGFKQSISVAVAADGCCAVIASSFGPLGVWDFTTERCQIINDFCNAVMSVAVTEGGRCVVLGFGDGETCMWNLMTGKSEWFKDHSKGVESVAVTPNGQIIVSGSSDQTVCMRNLPTGRVEVFECGDAVYSVAVTADGHYAVSGSFDGVVCVWDLVKLERAAVFTADAAVYSCAVSLDGTTVVAGDALGRVHFLQFIEPDPNVSSPAKFPFRLLSSS